MKCVNDQWMQNGLDIIVNYIYRITSEKISTSE